MYFWGSFKYRYISSVTTREMIEKLKVKKEYFDKKIIPDLVINNLSEIFKNS